VVYSVNVWLTTKGIGRSWFDFMAGAEKVDDTTVDIVTKEPAAILPSSLAFLYVFPPKYHQEAGQEGFGKKPIGTGAWKFVDWQPGVQLRVTPNPDYWGKKPSIQDIQFRWAPDASARVALLETGEVHLAQNVPPALVERVERSGQARIEAIKSIRKVFLMINIKDGPWQNPDVRRALNYALDVEGMIKTLFRGRAYGRDKGVIHEGFEGYQGDKLEPFSYDPDRAKKMLADAGFPNGFETTLWHPIGRYMLDKESSEAMAGQLAKVGIKANLQGMESGAYFNKLTSERVPGLQFFACGPLFMNPVFCSLVHFWGPSGYAYGSDGKTDDLIRAARSELDDQKRVLADQAMENYIYKDQVGWGWLWHQQDIYGASNKVNWKARSDELMSFEEAAFT
jgi:peptide/nickel transport system substrate-binding protein